jgi:excisionase family DNA binding protein
MEVELLNEAERRLLTVSAVAELTGLSPNAVYRAIAGGELRASKLRGRLRVQLADLDAWIDSNVVCARGEDDWSATPAEFLRAGRAGRGLRELLEADG